MIPFLYRLRTTFKWALCVCLVGCATSPSNDTTFLPIESFLIGPKSREYSLSIDHSIVGSADINIMNDYNTNLGGRVILFRQTVELNQQTGTVDLHLMDRTNGYFITIEGNPASEQFIPLPINKGDTMRGPFAGLTSEHVTLIIQAFHTQYTNQNGHEFFDVIEAESADGTIRMFFNEAHFIIQKEDYRYAPTIISLIQS
ncbi:MAG: hypothetical protein ISQ13_00860 [Candidatus Margulisbacteria bacterium]|nr:hypothetical protein [Candidatus Margulisiibacteriota bacterium]